MSPRASLLGRLLPLPAAGPPASETPPGFPWIAREGIRVGLLALALSAVCVLPFHLLARPPAAGGSAAWLRMPATHDLAMHFDHMRAFARGMAAGRIYPRWEEPTNGGFGAPSTAFHPPAVYYLTTVLYAAARDWGLTFLLTHIVLLAGSGVAAYACARRGMSAPAATAAMVAYLIAPYHLLDLYHRGALAELLGFVWMPLVWLFTEALFDAASRRDTRRAFACLGLAWGAFFWSHPPTAYTFVLATAVLAAGLASTGRAATRLLAWGATVALGLGLAAPYLLPALAEQDLVRSDVFRSRWAYAEHHVLLARPGDAPAAFWALINRAWFACLAVLALTAAPWLLANARARATAALRGRVVLWAAVAALLLALMTPAASALDPLVPGLAMTSFPWRMLGAVSLALALLVGALVEADVATARQGGPGTARSWSALALAVVCGTAVFSLLLVVAPMRGSEPFVPRPERFTANKFWVLPRWAPADPRQLPRVDAARLLGDRGRVTVERWDPETRVLGLELSGADRLAVRTFDFPGWRASLDGRPAAIERGALGDIQLALPVGRHRLVLDFGATPARLLGDAVGLVSLLAAVVALVLARSRV